MHIQTAAGKWVGCVVARWDNDTDGLSRGTQAFPGSRVLTQDAELSRGRHLPLLIGLSTNFEGGGHRSRDVVVKLVTTQCKHCAS